MSVLQEVQAGTVSTPLSNEEAASKAQEIQDFQLVIGITGIARPIIKLVIQYSGNVDLIETLDETEQQDAYRCVFDIYRDQKLLTRFKVTPMGTNFKAMVFAVHDKVMEFVTKHFDAPLPTKETMEQRVTPALLNTPELMQPVAASNSLTKEEIDEATYYDSYDDELLLQDELIQFSNNLIPVY